MKLNGITQSKGSCWIKLKCIYLKKVDIWWSYHIFSMIHIEYPSTYVYRLWIYICTQSFKASSSMLRFLFAMLFHVRWNTKLVRISYDAVHVLSRSGSWHRRTPLCGIQLSGSPSDVVSVSGTPMADIYYANW